MRLIARLEVNYEAIEQRVKLLEAKRDHKEIDERDAARVIKWASHLVENLDEMILDTQDDGLRGVFWSLIFCTTPTLEEFRNGTPPVSPLVRLKGVLSDENSTLVAQEGRRHRLAELGEELSQLITTGPDHMHLAVGRHATFKRLPLGPQQGYLL